MMTRDERVRALLGNIKNWSWDVTPQFRIEKEDGNALREYVSELKDEVYNLKQKIQELENKVYTMTN